jgi:hypothetical protein
MTNNKTNKKKASAKGKTNNTSTNPITTPSGPTSSPTNTPRDDAVAVLPANKATPKLSNKASTPKASPKAKSATKHNTDNPIIKVPQGNVTLLSNTPTNDKSVHPINNPTSSQTQPDVTSVDSNGDSFRDDEAIDTPLPGLSRANQAGNGGDGDDDDDDDSGDDNGNSGFGDNGSVNIGDIYGDDYSYESATGEHKQEVIETTPYVQPPPFVPPLFRDVDIQSQDPIDRALFHHVHGTNTYHQRYRDERFAEEIQFKEYDTAPVDEDQYDTAPVDDDRKADVDRKLFPDLDVSSSDPANFFIPKSDQDKKEFAFVKKLMVQDIEDDLHALQSAFEQYKISTKTTLGGHSKELASLSTATSDIKTLLEQVIRNQSVAESGRETTQRQQAILEDIKKEKRTTTSLPPNFTSHPVPIVTSDTAKTKYDTLTDGEIESLILNHNLWKAGEIALYHHKTCIYLKVQVNQVLQFDVSSDVPPTYIVKFLVDGLPRKVSHTELFKLKDKAIVNARDTPVPVTMHQETIKQGNITFVTVRVRFGSFDSSFRFKL